MKRDWTAVKKILLRLEGFEGMEQYLTPDMETGFSPDIVDYHIRLLEDAGLIEAETGLYPKALRLTWQGHEFLDSIRDEKMWNRVIKTAKLRGLTLSFEVIKAMTTAIIRELV